MNTTGDVLIEGFRESQNEAIIDVRLVDSDCDSYRKEKIQTLLDWQKRVKKDKHVKHFHNQCEHFFLFVLYVNGMLGKDNPIILANLSQLMAAKMKEPNSHV